MIDLVRKKLKIVLGLFLVSFFFGPVKAAEENSEIYLFDLINTWYSNEENTTLYNVKKSGISQYSRPYYSKSKSKNISNLSAVLPSPNAERIGVKEGNLLGYIYNAQNGKGTVHVDILRMPSAYSHCQGVTWWTAYYRVTKIDVNVWVLDSSQESRSCARLSVVHRICELICKEPKNIEPSSFVVAGYESALSVYNSIDDDVAISRHGREHRVPKRN